MSSIRAEERDGGLGMINGKQQKEREKVTEVELPAKYLKPFFRGNMMHLISLYLVKNSVSTIDFCLLKIIWKITKLNMTLN